MTIDYDLDADAAYIRLNNGTVESTSEESDVCILDLDSQGNIVAIELLSVFGFAGAALHALVRNGKITREIADSALIRVRGELAAA